MVADGALKAAASKRSAERIVYVLKSQRALLQPVYDALTGAHRQALGGRPFTYDPEHFVLLYVAYAAKGAGPVSKFLADVSMSTWENCGFDPKWDEDGDIVNVPSHDTVLDHFHRLAGHAAAWEQVINALILRAADRVPDIGRHLNIDGTTIPCAIGPQHACDAVPDHVCSGCADELLRVATTDQVKKAHWEDDRAPEEELKDVAKRRKFDRMSEAEMRAVGLDPSDPEVGRYTWFRQDGHYYRCVEKDGGMRKYKLRTGKIKINFGYIRLVLTDGATGAVVYTRVIRADQQEYKYTIRMINRFKELRGQTPHYVSGDSGQSYSEVTKALLREGIDPVMPLRGTRSKSYRPEDWANKYIDPDRVLRCPHCEGPTTSEGKNLGFRPAQSEGGTPRLRFKCLFAKHSGIEACKKHQQIDPTSNENDFWRMVRYTDHRSHTPFQIRSRSQNLEKAHREAKDNYGCGAEVGAAKLRMVGLEIHQLLSNVATFIDWFLMSQKFGWLAEVKRKYADLTMRPWATSGAWEETLEERARNGRDVPRVWPDEPKPAPVG